MRTINPKGWVSYGVRTHEEHQGPAFECDKCGVLLGNGDPQYHDEAGEWYYCPWCGSKLWE